MIILSEDAIKYVKKMYMKSCIKIFLVGAIAYTIINKMIEQDIRIDNLTNKIEELNQKGE